MSVKVLDFLRFFIIALVAIDSANADIISDARVAMTGRSASDTVLSRDSNVVRSGVRVERTAADRSAKNISRSATTARSATPNNVVRSATNNQKTSVVRSAINTKSATTSGRSATTPTNIARATAVFSDVSKIGSGYAECRDAYATCMDQFCAVMNDKYRRCYCSSRLTDFQDTEYALDQAVTLLAQFEDNNLNAVDKTAAEVNAMYSATAGENAVKRDTSGAAQLLDEIGDLLAGKKSNSTKNTFTSLNGTIIDFSTDISDIWSDTSSSSIFGSGAKDLSTLSGVDLYNNAVAQCLNMVSGSCQNDAVLNMAKSSYNIMITQDCNAYSKNIESKREQVKQTVRTAEKYLREARLEEYRSHNSDDMNACITKVKTAIQQDLACGESYKRCLDYTGAYISSATGEPIYTPRLFQLTDLITLGGIDDNRDVLTQNFDFNKFLDGKRTFAKTALDSCRDIADDVWTEFKRTALIEIAQAQDEKIESVKMSCVQTMAECYDTQSDGLVNMDTSTAKAAGALGVVAAREMCKDKVVACAALYADNGASEDCKFGSDGKLQNGARCGLNALLNFVDTVDTARVSEACDVALENYLKNMCTPDDGNDEYPYKCRLSNVDTIRKSLKAYAKTISCGADITGIDGKTVDVDTQINNLLEDLQFDMADTLSDACTEMGGYFVYPGDNSINQTDDKPLSAFYTKILGGNMSSLSTRSAISQAVKLEVESPVFSQIVKAEFQKPTVKNTAVYKEIKTDGATSNSSGGWGNCYEYTIKVACEALNTNDSVTYGTYDAATDTCILSDAWYKNKCENVLNGYWKDNMCYVGGE